MINIPLKVNGSLLYQDEIVKIASGASNSIQVTFTIPQESDFNDPTLTKKAIFRYYQGSYFISDVNANNEVIVPKFVIASPYFKVALRAENNDKTVVITTNEIQIPVDASPTLYDSTIVDGDVTIRNSDNTLHIYKVGDVTYIDFAQNYKSAVDGVINGNYATTSRVALIENSVAGIQSTLINVDSRLIALETAVGNIGTDIGGLDERLDAVEENKQDALVSGENIKTLNGASLLGSGDYAFDSAFDEESTNAVENQVISKTIREINYELAVIRESLFETILIELPYKVDYAFEYDVPSTLSDDDGTHRVVFSETQLDEIEGNSVVANQFCNFDYVGAGSLTRGIIAKGQNIKLEVKNNYGFQQSLTQLQTPIPAGHKVLYIYNKHSGVISSSGATLGGYHMTPKSWQGLVQMDSESKAMIFTTTDTVTDILLFLNSPTSVTEALDADFYYSDLTQLYGSGNEPTTTSDPRIQWLISYLESHPDYNAGSILNTKVSGLSCGESTISFPQVDLKGAGVAHDILKVVEGDVVEGEQLYNLVKITNVGGVDLGTLDWQLGGTFYASLPLAKVASAYSKRAICTKYQWGVPQSSSLGSIPDKTFILGNGYAFVYIKDSTYITVQDFTTAMSGVPFYYQLATSTQTTIATNLTFEQVTLLIQENAKINVDYLDVPPNVQTKFVVKKAIGE